MKSARFARLNTYARTSLTTGLNKLRRNKAPALLVLVGLLGISLFSSSASFRRQMTPANPNAVEAATSRALTTNPSFLSSSMLVEGIATFADDCTTAQDAFNLGDAMCAKAEGVPASLFPWRVLWIDPAGIVRQSDEAMPNDATEYRFTLPATPTSVVNGQIVDNRGTWRVNLVRSNGSVRQTARFVVSEENNPTSDVFVQKINRSSDGSVPSGGNIDFIIVVGNGGPSPATGVNLVDSLPSGATLVQFSQSSGPACAPADTPNCTIATLAYNERAEFTAIYNVGAAAPGTYETSATASSTSEDPNPTNDTGTTQFTVVAGGGGGTCELICPNNINAIANTTEGGERGAHVTYDEPISSGDCGSVSSVPASGSFFPVGTTVVTATSETGGGSCSFSITVIDTGEDPPTISCPANPAPANADSNCSAGVTVGTATASGNNVTLFATRSDGRPMYTCDDNGNCTRNSSDQPFQVGTTTITWFAFAHDSAGPYTTPGPKEGDTFEEQHRTGAASCTQLVVVNDVTAPTIVAPANQTASADETCMFVLPDYTTSATVSDNCACASSDTSEICDTRHPITITQSPEPGTTVPLGTTTITLTANDGSSNNDGAGNTATAQFTVTVNDTTAPTVTAPADSSADADASCQAPVPDYVSGSTASDNCDSSVTITQSPTAGTLVGPGAHTVTVTATDDAGNFSTDEVVFTVNDVTPPTISCPANITVYLPLNSSATSVVVNFTAPTGTDNCSGATTAQTDGLASGALFPVGTTTNTFTVTDGAGLTASCSFTVTVLYNFTGFFSPVSNPPILNNVNAGRAIPLKFSLSGNKGLDIFAAGYPASEQIACDSSAPLSELEGTVTSGGSTLTYSPDQYHYSWKTESSWAGTCRRLVVKLNDGTEHVALFKFK